MFKFANKQSVINDIMPNLSAWVSEEQLTELYEKELGYNSKNEISQSSLVIEIPLPICVAICWNCRSMLQSRQFAVSHVTMRLDQLFAVYPTVKNTNKGCFC